MSREDGLKITLRALLMIIFIDVVEGQKQCRIRMHNNRRSERLKGILSFILLLLVRRAGTNEKREKKDGSICKENNTGKNRS